MDPGTNLLDHAYGCRSCGRRVGYCNKKKGRTVSLILGAALLIVCCYYIPYMLTANPYEYYKHLGLWGDGEKELAFCGIAFVIEGVHDKN